MRTQFVVICALAQGLSVAQARIGQRFTVEADDISFAIDYSDSSSSNPYSVIFRQDGVRSRYRYRRDDGFVRKMNIGDLRYSAVYRNDDTLRRVNDLNRRRALFGEDAEDVDEDIMIPSARRLALLTCDDCETVWNFICYGGMDTLCDMIDADEEPLAGEDDVDDSITTMCYTLRDVCNESSAAEVCNDQCEKCLRAVTFTLEWSDRNTDMDLRIDEPNGTAVRWNNREGSVGYLDQDSLSGGPETYRVWNGLSTNTDVVLGTYTVAPRLVSNRGDAASVSWVLTGEMNGVTVMTETGEFDTNGDQSDFTYNLSTYIDNGCENETLASIIAVEGDADRDTETKEGSPGTP